MKSHWFLLRGYACGLAGLFFVTTGYAAHPALPVIPTNIFNVTSFGAIGDGTTDNTTNIQAAINAANAAGGGIVEIPAGTFLSGPITLLSSINLQVDTNGLLQALPYSAYPGAGTTNPPVFIYCNSIHDLEISGHGRIDGQGAGWWAIFNTNAALIRPMMLNLYSVNRLFIHDITYSNPAFHHCGLRNNGGNITISNLTVSTTAASPNTDGLNFVGTNCIIENCHISDGDDNIAMGSTGPLVDLLITNCVFGTGHGVSLGSGISYGVTNLTVANCSFTGTQNGIRMKCNMGDSRPMDNLNYFNLTMTNVNYPIVIYTYYNEIGNPGNISTAQVLAASNIAPITATTPMWRDITISNLYVSSAGVIGGIIWGPTEMPISNVTLVHITESAPKTFDLYNVRGVKIIDSQFSFATGNTFTLCNAGVTISNSVPGSAGVTIGGATSSNALALYNTTASLNSSTLFGANPFTLGAGVLTNTGSLTLSASTVQNFALGASGSTVVVTSNLVLNGTINITSNSGFGVGAYTLFTYSGSLSGNPTLGSTPAGFTCSINTNTAKQVVLLVSQPGSAASQSLFGATEAASGQSTLMQIDPATGNTTTLFSFPLSFPKVGQLTYFPDTGQFVICTDAGETPTLAFVNPATHAVTEVGVTGLTTNTAMQGVAYYPPLDAFVVTCGPAGKNAQNRLALVSANGQVIGLSSVLPFPDADNVVYNPASGLLEIVDLNDTTGVQAVSNPFSGSPTFVKLAATLNDGFAGAPAISSGGQMFVPEFTNNVLLTLSGSSFVTAASFGGTFSSTNPITTLAFASGALPPQGFTASLNGAGLQFQLIGSPGAPYVLLSATNLVPPILWQAVVTNLADTNGNWAFTDTNDIGSQQRYYRAATQ